MRDWVNSVPARVLSTSKQQPTDSGNERHSMLINWIWNEGARRLMRARIIALLTFTIWVAAVASASAAIRSVTSLADSGPGSLRQVIADSAAGDTILFEVAGTITLTNGQLVLTKSLTIVGPGNSALAINGNKVGRIFSVSTNIIVTLSSLTMEDGLADQGGGINNAGGTLVLHYCSLSRNAAIGPLRRAIRAIPALMAMVARCTIPAS